MSTPRLFEYQVKKIPDLVKCPERWSVNTPEEIIATLEALHRIRIGILRQYLELPIDRFIAVVNERYQKSYMIARENDLFP